jgi:FtsH-binding integral membrane protein
LKTDWKILLVLSPGALLGAGAGALVAAFQFAAASSLAAALQTTGIILMVCSIILRILMSERGLKLSDYGGLGINGICVLLSGVIAISLTNVVLQTESATGALAVAAIVLSGVPALLLTAAGALAVARLRQR